MRPEAPPQRLSAVLSRTKALKWEGGMTFHTAFDLQATEPRPQRHPSHKESQGGTDEQLLDL